MKLMETHSSPVGYDEVSRDEWLGRLTADEGVAVEELLPHFVEVLEREAVQSPILLAVGSSTYPNWYWVERKRLKQRYPEETRDLLDSYKDINIRLLADGMDDTDRMLFQGVMDKHLKDQGYELILHGGMDAYSRGVETTENTIICPRGRFRSLEVTHPSTFFRSTEILVPGLERAIELIYSMGMVDSTYEEGMNARMKVNVDRKHGESFAVLYPDFFS